MARSMETDFLNGMRFHVVATGIAGRRYLSPPGRPEAGFSAVTTPEVSAESVEYREGTTVYTFKYPGVPSMGGDITMSRGVARRDTTLYDWMKVVLEGSTADGGEYRADVDIKQFHRREVLVGDPTAPQNFNTIDVNSAPAKTYRIFNAFPTRCKPAADFDATSSDVSVAELDVAYESFVIIEPTP
jgi:phage tail-like protein